MLKVGREFHTQVIVGHVIVERTTFVEIVEYARTFVPMEHAHGRQEISYSSRCTSYEVATMSRLPKNTGLFYKRAL